MESTSLVVNLLLDFLVYVLSFFFCLSHSSFIHYGRERLRIKKHKGYYYVGMMKTIEK